MRLTRPAEAAVIDVTVALVEAVAALLSLLLVSIQLQGLILNTESGVILLLSVYSRVNN